MVSYSWTLSMKSQKRLALSYRTYFYLGFHASVIGAAEPWGLKNAGSRKLDIKVWQIQDERNVTRKYGFCISSEHIQDS